LRLALLSAAALLAALALLLGTETGLRLGLRLAHNLAPGRVAVERIEGHLLGRLRLEGLMLKAADSSLRIRVLQLDWQPWRLATGRLRIDDLSARGIDLWLAEATPPPPEAEPLRLPTLDLPITLELKRLRVHELRVHQPGRQAPLTLDAASLAGDWQGTRIKIHNLQASLSAFGADARARGWLQLHDAYPLGLDLTWQLSTEPLGIGKAQLAGKASLRGDTTHLHIDQTLSGSVDAQLQATLSEPLADLGWEADLRVEHVDLPAFASELPTLDLSAKLQGKGGLAAAQVKGGLRARSETLPEYGTPEISFDLDWQQPILTVHGLQLTEPRSGARLALEGSLGIEATGIGLVDLRGRWQRLAWPPVGEHLAESSSGSLRLEGDPEAFKATLAAEVAGAEIPSAALSLKLTGNTRSVRIERLAVEALNGKALLNGKVAWDPALSWQATLAFDDIDPGTFLDQWPGRLGARIVSDGGLVKGRVRSDTAIQELQGTLRGYPVSAAGRVLAQQGETWQLEVPDLSLSSGPSHLSVAGKLGRSLALSLAFHSPDLQTLLPDAAGRLDLEGKLGGTPQAPSLTLSLAGSDLQLAEQAVKRAELKVDTALGTADRVHLDLTAEGLSFGGMQWQRARLRARGGLTEHRLQARLEQGPVNPSLELSGQWQRQSYRGQVEKLRIHTRQWGDWALESPARIELLRAQQGLAAGPLCLREARRRGHVCGEAELTGPGAWHAELDARLEDLSLLAPLLPPELELDAKARLSADLRAVDQVLHGRVDLQIPRGRAEVHLDAAHQTLRFDNAYLRINAGRESLLAKLRIPLADLGGLEAELTLPQWRLDRPLHPSQVVRGRLHGGIRNLAAFAPLGPDLEKLRGRIDTDLRIGGRLDRPELAGYAKLENAGVDIPVAGLKLRDMRLEAEARDTQRIDYSGTVTSGKGRLRLSGSSRQDPEQGWLTRLRLQGKKVTAADTWEYKVRVSPDLTLEQSADRIRIGGEVKVTDASITPRSLPPGTVEPSGDVVVKLPGDASQYDRNTPGTGIKLYTDVSIKLRDDVVIEAFGLHGRLRGNLKVLGMPGRPLLGDGQLSIKDGSYRIFRLGNLTSTGQVNIEQGRLVFAKTPLDDPGLFLLSKREVGDSSVALKVTGTVKHPEMSFYSETNPGMSQSEALNYLLTGKSSMWREDDEDEDRSLSAGGYITPELYVEYDTGNNGQSAVTRIRYDITDKIQVQTESGDDQGADLFFKFEY
jgi:translocation and assembly module TamB